MAKNYYKDESISFRTQGQERSRDSGKGWLEPESCQLSLSPFLPLFLLSVLPRPLLCPLFFSPLSLQASYPPALDIGGGWPPGPTEFSLGSQFQPREEINILSPDTWRRVSLTQPGSGRLARSSQLWSGRGSWGSNMAARPTLWCGRQILMEDGVTHWLGTCPPCSQGVCHRRYLWDK